MSRDRRLETCWRDRGRGHPPLTTVLSHRLRRAASTIARTTPLATALTGTAVASRPHPTQTAMILETLDTPLVVHGPEHTPLSLLLLFNPCLALFVVRATTTTIAQTSIICSLTLRSNSNHPLAIHWRQTHGPSAPKARITTP